MLSVSATAQTEYTVLYGTNDVLQYGASAPKMAAYVNFMRAIVAWLATPTKVLGQAMTQSGTWSNVANGISTTTANDTATATVSGTAVYVAYQLANSAGMEGTYEIRVDGVLAATITANGTAIGNTFLGLSAAPAAVRISGLSAGSHSVQIKNTVGGKGLIVYWVAGNTQAAYARVLAGTITAQNPAVGTIATYNTALVTMLTDLQTDGLDVRVPDSANILNTGTDLSGDGIHPNAAGYAKIGAEFYRLAR